MINEYNAKKFCSEPIERIENYAQAMADNTQTWCCHHRGEILSCGRYLMKTLKEFGLYYHRPASELIFMTDFEHRSLHTKGNNNHLGKHHTDEAKKKISEARNGSHRSEETCIKLAEASKGNTNVRGMSWWHKGHKTKRSFSCPGDGWVRGRK